MIEDKYCKRLIEVEFPIKKISFTASREKSIRHGHISTLHIWGQEDHCACRAVLCASLPDSVDQLCPEEFRRIAKDEMRDGHKNHLTLVSAESMELFLKIYKKPSLLEDNLFLRKALLAFISDFADWNNSVVKQYQDSSNKLTQIAHEEY